eukprot:1462961-Rhodomonas_salina.2
MPGTDHARMLVPGSKTVAWALGTGKAAAERAQGKVGQVQRRLYWPTRTLLRCSTDGTSMVLCIERIVLCASRY